LIRYRQVIKCIALIGHRQVTWRSDASAHTFRSITLMQKHHQTWRSDASVPVTFDCAARCRPAGGSKPFTGAATCHTRLYHEEGYLFFARSVKKSKLLIISALTLTKIPILFSNPTILLNIGDLEPTVTAFWRQNVRGLTPVP